MMYQPRTKTAWRTLAVIACVAFLSPAAFGEDAKVAEKAPAAATPPPAAQPQGGLGEFDKFIDATKTPFPWFSWGGDIRFRNEFQLNAGLNREVPLGAARRGVDQTNYQRYRTRIWSTVTPAKGVDLNFRITWEGRHMSSPDSIDRRVQPTWVPGGVAIDNANVKLAEFAGTPLTMILGRQDIMLGDGWLVMDGTPNDGSRTFFFDAARFVYNFKELNTTADLIFIDQRARGNGILPPLLVDNRGPQFANVIEQNERGLIFWVSNKSIQNTELNGYYMYKDNDREIQRDPYGRNLFRGDDGYIHAFGGRIAGSVGDHWKYRAEGAYEFGRNGGSEGSDAIFAGPVFPDRYLRAFGFNSELAYWFKDQMNNQLRLQYEYLSGDDPDTPSTNEGFILLWGRWPRFSEFLGYHNAASGQGRQYDITNYHRLAGGWSVNPCQQLLLATDYHLLFAPENPLGFRNRRGYSESGEFRGELLTFLAQYTFSKHLKAHILSEFFFPGNYFADSRNDVGMFLRGEIFFTW